VNWLAILLSLASLGGSPAPGEAPKKPRCEAVKQQGAKKQSAAKKQKCKPAKPKKNKKAKSPAPRKPPASGQPQANTPEAPSDAPRPSDPVAPQATPAPPVTPAPTAQPTPAPTPAPPGTYPTRTGVDLGEWFLRTSYRTLAAGRVSFNVSNQGEDDHNFIVRSGAREQGRIELMHPGDTETLSLDLGLGSYTLYCSLVGHADAGMRATINVR
jgi:uncharacterized cupredoxin-like copper-binding protein